VTTKSPTKPSTPRLSEAARHVAVPSGIVSTAWPRVRAKAAELGIRYDYWQEQTGQLALAKREDGTYAATVGGVVLSIPRQVGKTYLVGSMVLVMCILFPNLTVLWTAHHLRTTKRTFESLQGMANRKRVKPHVKAIRLANGEQEITFHNGSVIMFGAREQGFGRGFDEVDIEVFDEAQILTERALDDMIAATNQSRQEAGALLFFIGTPPRPTDPGELFTNKRKKALAGDSDNLVYVEFSADQGADPDDPKQWAKANPSYPTHTSDDAMLRMRENLDNDESFMREALGIWSAESSSQVIDSVSWAAIADAESIAVDMFALAVDVSPDRTVASVSMAGQREDGLWHVELDEQRNGVGWLPGYLEQIVTANPQIRALVIDRASPAASIVDDLAKLRVKVTLTNAPDMAAACGQFYDGVYEGWLRHIDQPQLNVALSVARKRNLGDAWAWNRKSASSDITPLVACTLALWGAQSSTVKKPGRKARTEGRKAVVL
jgi:hypothetical protein